MVPRLASIPAERSFRVDSAIRIRGSSARTGSGVMAAKRIATVSTAASGTWRAGRALRNSTVRIDLNRSMLAVPQVPVKEDDGNGDLRPAGLLAQDSATINSAGRHG